MVCSADGDLQRVDADKKEPRVVGIEGNFNSRLSLGTVRRSVEPVRGEKCYRVANGAPALTDPFF